MSAKGRPVLRELLKSRGQAGLTLFEVLIAVLLLSLLSAGMLTAIRMGFNTMHSTDDRLMANRRVAGAQRILEQELAGFMPVAAQCLSDANGPQPFNFFQGQPQSMRLVSTYSLQEAWRGRPRILELQVIPGEQGRGVRLIVNEIPYTGPVTAGAACIGMRPNPESGFNVPIFAPIFAGPQSFVLADKLAFCRFSYLQPAKPPDYNFWRPDWVLKRSPIGIRVELAPIEDNRARLRPLTVSAVLPINRNPDITYVDY